MAGNSADAKETAVIRRLASAPGRVAVTTTTKYDLMARDLTTTDVCDAIVAWIDGNGRVKRVTMRGRHAGQTAYEMKPRIGGELFYLKVTVCSPGEPDEQMLIVSAHLDH